jgi:hypothetical protein
MAESVYCGIVGAFVIWAYFRIRKWRNRPIIYIGGPSCRKEIRSFQAK